MVLPLLAAGWAADQLFNGGGATDAVGGAVKEGWNDFQNAGTNRFKATPYDVQDSYYGGYDGGARDMSQIGLKRMGQAGAGQNWAMGEMQGYRGPQATENAQLSQNEANSRGWDQAGAIQLAREAAMGQAPSEAAYLMQAGLNQGMAGQTSLAGSARGAAAIAQAQGNAAGNVANMQGNAYTQGAALRAQEMANARGMYGGLAGQQRDQDLQRLGMGNQMSQFNAGLNDQYKLGMGQLANQFGNNQLGWYTASQNPYNNQLQADVNTQQQRNDAWNQAQSINAGVNQANADNKKQFRNDMIGLGGTLLSGAMSKG